MQASLHGIEFQKCYKVGISKLCLSVVFNYYFINYYFTILKRIEFKLYFYYFMQAKSLFAKFIKFYWKILFYFENMVATVLKGYFKNSIKPLQLVGGHLNLKCKIYEEIKKTKKGKRRKEEIKI
jgi:hypothetical protein